MCFAAPVSPLASVIFALYPPCDCLLSPRRRALSSFLLYFFWCSPTSCICRAKTGLGFLAILPSRSSFFHSALVNLRPVGTSVLTGLPAPLPRRRFRAGPLG